MKLLQHAQKSYRFSSMPLHIFSRLITNVPQVDPGNAKALFLRGSTFLKKRAYHEALSDFSNLLRRDLKHVEGLYHRGT
jgi:hypothetical protein